MRIRFDRESVWKSVVAGGFMAIGVAVLQVLHASVSFLLVYVAAGAFVYLLALKALRGLSGADVSVIERTLPESLRWTVKPIRRMFG